MIVTVTEEGRDPRYLTGVEAVVTEWPNQVRLIRSNHEDDFLVITRHPLCDGDR